MKTKLLIVDDDEEIRAQLKWSLQSDYEIHLAEERAQASRSFAMHRPSVVLLDLGLPPKPNSPEEGFLALSEMLQSDPLAKIAVISGQNERENALEAIGLGAFDFLAKPIDPQELAFLIKRCVKVSELERENQRIKQAFHSDAFEGMVGSSRPMQRVFEAIRKVSKSDAPVLVLGESGTGKEMVARAIHQRSPRSGEPFVAINCSAVPESLLESELFGHEKGSFTGAHEQRRGWIEQAEGGTLFLDEIGDVPLHVQVKLLRFLQEQSIERVGGRTQIIVNARVVAATNADVSLAIKEGKFREDFYYRLAVVEMTLPALRDREEDITHLAQSLLARFADQNGRPGITFGKMALRAIQCHSWPGNVRELQNRIRRAVIMADNTTLTPLDIELSSSSTVAPGSTLRDARDNADRKAIANALQKHAGKISPAASELGISRPTLYELIEKLGIDRRAVG